MENHGKTGSVKKLRIALAQINTTVGDFSGNRAIIADFLTRAQRLGADIVAFPELAVTGYPPEDLLLKEQFIDDNMETLKAVQADVTGIVAIVGFVHKTNALHNAAAVICDGNLIDVYHKMRLPNYGVFDEFRYFSAGGRIPIYRIGRYGFGVNICEDIWSQEGPTRAQSLAGASVIINISASPYHMGKAKTREEMLSRRAVENGVAIAYVNAVGGQDELVFDGDSLIVDASGRVIARGKQFEEDLVVADIDLAEVARQKSQAQILHGRLSKRERACVHTIAIPRKLSPRKKELVSPHHPSLAPLPDALGEVYAALVLGTTDYVRKNGFKAVVIGLSGGIDSSLVASIAVDALGAERVNGLFMPSPYTSPESREDARALARNLGISLREVPIDAILASYLTVLRSHFRGLPEDVTEENIQARIRGNLLMAFSNKFGWLVLTTGNKSEMSVGYATLYGDMAGGFAVIKDVPKTMVYQLCRWKNTRAGRSVIPERMFTKEPSAELKPGQKDTDVLPPYDILDPILKAYVEEDRSIEEIVSIGYDVERIRNVIRMVDTSEYKRRQSPPGIKITQKAFGRDRRFPITNRYRGY